MHEEEEENIAGSFLPSLHKEKRAGQWIAKSASPSRSTDQSAPILRSYNSQEKQDLRIVQTIRVLEWNGMECRQREKKKKRKKGNWFSFNR